MNILELQNFLFKNQPKRAELYNYKPSLESSYKIGIYRNHSFELVEHTITPFLEYAEIGADFVYSDYDDSLTFFGLDDTVDMLILWLDMERYKTLSDNFLQERIDFLKTIYKKPILFIPVNADFVMETKGNFIFWNLEEITKQQGENFLDIKKEKFTGTRLSAAACLEISRQLGTRYIPSILHPTLKAIVVDLDNTLYEGVLGEDGIEKVNLTEGHKALQQQLKSLKNQGFFLAIASKNDDRDVDALLEQRSDFLLKKEDFSMICASWDSKASSIKKIAEFLNIHENSFLFIDDNLGEINSVLSVVPEVHVIHAYEDAFLTTAVLKNYPGLLKLTINKEDSLRSEDAKANQSRTQIRNSMSEEEYIRHLEIELTFNLNNMEHAKRVTELSNKTNQFIFGYQRYFYETIEEYMKSTDHAVVTVSLKDKLSESGIIGVCVATKQESFISIEELFVSCRALGRGIDDVIVLGMIQEICSYFNNNTVKVTFIKGERNLPAEQFANKHLLKYIEEPSVFEYQKPQNLLTIKAERFDNHE